VRTLCAIACLTATALAPGAARGACSVSTSGISFGAYNPFSAASLAGSGSMTLSCSGSVVAYVMLSGGSSNNAGARRMTSGAERLSYNIYRDAALTRIWGDGSAYPGVWVSLPQAPLPFYGSIPPGQDVAAGDYADALTITVNFY
jgi:spore coat protein U-like protein